MYTSYDDKCSDFMYLAHYNICSEVYMYTHRHINIIDADRNLEKLHENTAAYIIIFLYFIFAG